MKYKLKQLIEEENKAIYVDESGFEVIVDWCGPGNYIYICSLLKAFHKTDEFKQAPACIIVDETKKYKKYTDHWCETVSMKHADEIEMLVMYSEVGDW